VTVDRDERELLDSLEDLDLVNGSADILPDADTMDFPRITSTMLLLTERCNLRCQYCYSKAERAGADMSFEIARAAVDFIIDNARSTHRGQIGVNFHGGGEPTLNWRVLTKTVDYLRSRCREAGIKSATSICTNGMVSRRQAEWLGANIDNILVSIDGRAATQDFQRPRANGGPSYAGVAATLAFFDEERIPFSLRSTVTDFSEGDFVADYRHLVETFHPVNMCVEPLFVCGRCESATCSRPTQEGFIGLFSRILEETELTKVPISYSGGRIFQLDTAFCGAAGHNFFVTARGMVTACVEVASENDSRAGQFIYGRFDPGKKGFDFDLEVYRSLAGLRVQYFDGCGDCLAKYHCCGDCLAKSPDLLRNPAMRNGYRCAINKELTTRILLNEYRRLSRRVEEPASAQGGSR
ncbi:MAG: radical SAM protein, partial [Spirochaetota bacterium]